VVVYSVSHSAYCITSNNRAMPDWQMRMVSLEDMYRIKEILQHLLHKNCIVTLDYHQHCYY